jgi:hypothetical protein
MRSMFLRCRISGRRARFSFASALALLTALLALFVAGAPTLRAQQAIQVYMSAVDNDGKPVMDLKAEDVAIQPDGAECKTTKFEAIDWPVKLQLLVDNGPVHTDALRQTREALRLFIKELPTDMEVTLVSFSPAPRAIYKAGSDRVKLLAAVDLIIPDSGAPKFIDALSEAADRVAKDKKNKEKGNYFPVIMMVGSSGLEGSNARDYQVTKLFKDIQDSASTVHIVMQSNPNRSSDIASGSNGIEVGIRVTQLTGGRYEAINTETRLSTLLPEYAKQIVKSHQRMSHQYRITCQPPEKSAPKQITASTLRAGMSAALTLDGRVP